MATRTPPRYVPTLTEVVRSPTPIVTSAPVAADEEQWVRKIMQRVELTLDRRLREAVAAVIVEQTRNLAPLLREEVEGVVREAVAQALADELAAARRGSGKS